LEREEWGEKGGGGLSELGKDHLSLEPKKKRWGRQPTEKGLGGPNKGGSPTWLGGGFLGGKKIYLSIWGEGAWEGMKKQTVGRKVFDPELYREH